MKLMEMLDRFLSYYEHRFNNGDRKVEIFHPVANLNAIKEEVDKMGKGYAYVNEVLESREKAIELLKKKLEPPVEVNYIKDLEEILTILEKPDTDLS